MRDCHGSFVDYFVSVHVTVTDQRDYGGFEFMKVGWVPVGLLQRCCRTCVYGVSASTMRVGRVSR